MNAPKSGAPQYTIKILFCAISAPFGEGLSRKRQNLLFFTIKTLSADAIVLVLFSSLHFIKFCLALFTFKHLAILPMQLLFELAASINLTSIAAS